MPPFRPWQATGKTKHSVAEKATCAAGHKHDSKREAKRCNQLHLLAKGGAISGIVTQPFYGFGGAKLANGQEAGVTLDFGYTENGKPVVEDVKGRSKLSDSRDWPLRKAMFKHFYPGIELREVRAL